MKKLWLCLILCIVGCTPNPESLVGKTPPKAVWSDSRQSESSDVVAIEKALESVSKEDCELLYHMFGGLSLYVERYPDGVKSNNQALGLFALVKTRYGLKSDGFDKTNTIIETRLKNDGFETPKDFDSDGRTKFSKAFSDFRDGALKAWRSKK